MRLIHLTHLTLHDFPQNQIPAYAILSHTWTKEEVTFAEFSGSSCKTKLGYHKIQSFCAKAAEHGYEYGWVDTCCIDKSSSAELSEAINSMYRWYENAEVCYVYLDDVSREQGSTLTTSRWFTRGWTLQELLAPSIVLFYDREWSRLGYKTELGSDIHQATGINLQILNGSASIFSTSIAHRMSWAANRETTRSEDIAYCLMGLFDVNMPMLYGEGEKAFRRLQEEIMKTSTDQSLFAWEHTSDDPDHGGLLACHPRNFGGCGRFEDTSALLSDDLPPYTVTSQGVSMTLFCTLVNDPSSLDLQHGTEHSWIQAVLTCTEESDPGRFAVIILRPLGQTKHHYVRVKRATLERSILQGKATDILIRHDKETRRVDQLRHRFFEIEFLSNNPHFAGTVEALAFTPLHNPKPISVFQQSGMLDFSFDHYDSENLGSTTDGTQRPVKTSKGKVGRAMHPFHISFPLGTRYALPMLPGREATRLRLSFTTNARTKEFWIFSIGLDEKGQVGCKVGSGRDVHCINETSDSKYVEIVKFVDYARLRTYAPDLRLAKAEEVCKVKLCIDQIVSKQPW